MSVNLGYVRRLIQEEPTTVMSLLEEDLGKEKARKSQANGSMKNGTGVKRDILHMVWYSWTTLCEYVCLESCFHYWSGLKQYEKE